MYFNGLRRLDRRLPSFGLAGTNPSHYRRHNLWSVVNLTHKLAMRYSYLSAAIG